ncbi:hypothetical protein RSPO_m00038 (plasmid) [Ralstonia solanacearum Po82]|uniref:Uncharacterized protein n=1 Tax=Ralstonia solanacearum (strain Po82) TaxID=1031711 RepID=F6G803_RALS8|nr:hypothetical protein RSPO_m00038 [Ralstonia solanacearum Po82]
MVKNLGSTTGLDVLQATISQGEGIGCLSRRRCRVSSLGM